MAGTIGILTAGGDSPGLNPAIRAIGKTALRSHDMHVIGFRDGRIVSDTTQNALINIVTIFLGLAVGSRLSADQFLQMSTLAILALGIVAFGIGTASGVLMEIGRAHV